MERISFISMLSSLLTDGVPLQKAIETIEKSSNITNKVKKMTSRINKSLQEGRRFSAALTDEKNAVPKNFLMFIASCEQSGSIANVMNFINQEENFKKEAKKQILEVAIYPILVFCLVIVGVLLLYFISPTYLSSFISQNDFLEYKRRSFLGILFAFFILILWLLTFFLFAKKTIFYDKKNDIFRSLLFLVNAGFSLCDSVDMTIGALNDTCLEKNSLLLVLSCLKKGESTEKAFKKSKLLQNELLVNLELAEYHGSISKAFSLILKHLDDSRDKKRVIFRKLTEPILMMGVGVFVIIVIGTSILPLLSNFEIGL